MVPVIFEGMFVLEFHAATTFPGFSLGLNDRAQRPVVLFSALSFFLSALSFFQRPVIFREPFGFFGLSSALFWAWSCRKRPIKAKGGAIFVHHVVIRVGHRRHLGVTMNINLCKLVRPVLFQDQLVTLLSLSLDGSRGSSWLICRWASGNCSRKVGFADHGTRRGVKLLFSHKQPRTEKPLSGAIGQSWLASSV